MANFGYPYNDLVICKDSTDYLIILLGNFRIELAFFGAVGTYIADSGVFGVFTYRIRCIG